MPGMSTLSAGSLVFNETVDYIRSRLRRLLRQVGDQNSKGGCDDSIGGRSGFAPWLAAGGAYGRSQPRDCATPTVSAVTVTATPSSRCASRPDNDGTDWL